MKKYSLVLLIFLSLNSGVYSQKIGVGKLNDYNVSLFDRSNNTIFVYGSKNYKRINLENFSIDSIPITIAKDFKYSNYHPLFVDSLHFFIHNKGGMVFQNRNDSIVRVDNSFNHLMQNNSSIFAYDSKIHRFGGYGFWSARNFITFFDNSIKEWEVINPINSEVVPEESFAGMYFLVEDDLYIFNSLYNNPLNRQEDIFNNKLWKYNFKKKDWKYLGETEFVEETLFLPNVTYKNKLMVNLSSKIIVIDIINNTIKEFEKGTRAHYFYRDFESVFNENRFYYFTDDDFDNLYLEVALESEVIGKEISSKPFYTNYKKLKMLGISILVLLFLIMSYKFATRILQKKNKVQILENGLLFKKHFIQLDDESMNILSLLISKEKVSSTNILKIIEKEQFSRAHNERLKFQKIEDLNFRLKTLLSVDDDMIISKKSSYDRRIREYILKNKAYFLTK